jgi:hypothetical protein
MKKLILLTALLVMCACEIDHGLSPAVYKIAGKIIFFKGKPPANTDRIEVFALKEFPPQDPQNFLYLGQSGALDYSRGDTVDYELNVAPTSYQLIGLLWKEKDKNWNLTGLLGIYTHSITTILPDSVVVSKKTPIVDNINLYANWERVSKDAHIAGSITYKGDWPSKTSLLLLAVYAMKPTSEFTYFAFENVDYSQPLKVDSSTFDLAVNSGTYNYVALYWVSKNISKLTDLVEIGAYKNPMNPNQNGVVTVHSNETLKGIDIEVDFNKLNLP